MATFDLNFFFLAACNGDVFILKKHLDAGIDIHSCDDLALRLATKANHTKAIIFLLSRGANIQAVYDAELRRYSVEGNTQAVKILLEDYSCSQEAKIYAMYNAIFCRHEDIIKLLLQNGVSPTANNNAVLNVAKYSNNDKIIALFENYLN